MKIPKSFKMINRTITVEFVDNLMFKDDDIGQARYREDKILLQKISNTTPYQDELIEETFLHEKFHWLFHMAEEPELRDNEKLIRILSKIWRQSEASV